jgi:hypothetical protein
MGPGSVEAWVRGDREAWVPGCLGTWGPGDLGNGEWGMGNGDLGTWKPGQPGSLKAARILLPEPGLRATAALAQPAQPVPPT